MLLRAPLRVLALCFAASSCAGTISGDVDGESVPPLLSAGLGVARAGDVEIAVGVFASSYGACELSARFVEELLSKDIADDNDVADVVNNLGAFAQDVPDDLWVLGAVAIGDVGDVNGELDMDEGIEGAALFVALCHSTRRPELDDDGLAFHTVCFGAEDGVLSSELSPERWRLEGELELEELDGDDDANVSVSAEAGRCDPLVAAVDAMAEECDASSNNCSFAGEALTAALNGGVLSSRQCEPSDCSCDGSCGGECRFTDDGECDEPEGTDLCPEGTDANDCF